MPEIAVSFRANFEVENVNDTARYEMRKVLMEWLREAVRNSNTNRLHKELEAAAGVPVSEFYLYVIDDLT